MCALALAGCPGKATPEADPATVRKLAATMLANQPVPAAVRACAPAELMGGATLTYRTLLQIAGRPMPPKIDHTVETWVNPSELDAPAATVLADDHADPTAERQAAAELLAAPFFLVYRVDQVDAPMALGIKELKRGTVGARAIRYDKAGAASCVQVFQWQNGFDKTKWGIDKSTMTLMDPAVVKAMQEDLRLRMLDKVGSLAAPPGPPPTRALETPRASPDEPPR